MADDILSEFGNDSARAQGGSRATNGGQQTPKDLAYSPPQGPKGQMQQGPGLHGDNCGTCGTQGKH
jgi:hypothetical protein